MPVPCLLERRAESREDLVLLCSLSAAVYQQLFACTLFAGAPSGETRGLLCPGISSDLSEAVYQQLFACTLFARAPSGETRGLGAALPRYQQLFIRSCLSAAVCLVPCLLERRAERREDLVLLCPGINSCTVWPVPRLLARRAVSKRTWCCFGWVSPAVQYGLYLVG